MAEQGEPAKHGKHIVVVGAGFGGLYFCKRFRGDARITVIDRQNHHLFQPLLYQVATAGLSAPEIAEPVRTIFSRRPRIEVVMHDVSAIDLNGKQIDVGSRRLDYDYLVLAVGNVTNYFGHDNWAEHALGLKTLDDAMAIRKRILSSFERAEFTDDPDERKRLMTIVIVGGGPTGVEMAGALAELTRRVFRRDFRRIDPSHARVILIEGGRDVLEQYPEELSASARKQLERMGVQVWIGHRVTDIQAGRVTIGEESIDAANIIWAAGVSAAPITRSLGVELNRAGQVMVKPDLSIPGHPESFVIGDAAYVPGKAGKPVPGVAPAAIQMGRFVAGLIEQELSIGPNPAEQRPAFSYKDRGSLATIGRKAAVADLGRFRFSGYFAWVAWLVVHLIFLIGFRNRAAVMLQWFYEYVTFKRGARIIVSPDRPNLDGAPARAEPTRPDRAAG